jgi:NAD(P)-dependent dehydrogenase (short-subunit alcohol dehydrogenase family)
MSTVLIAGANRGLGLEFVRQYAAVGDRVIAACRTPAKADALVAIAASSGGKVTVHPLEMTEDSSIRAFKSVIGDQPIDVAIANAGIYGGNRQGWNDMDFDAWARTFAVNTMAPLRLAQIVYGNLKAGKGKTFVGITSQMGSNAGASTGMHAYRTSKAALNKLVSTLATEWRGDGIIAVPMHPGWVRTDMGGANAPLSPEESVGSMRDAIAGLKPDDSGRFLNYDGSTLPW